MAQRVVKFDGKSDRLDNYFLKYWCMSSPFQQDLQSLATGSTALGIKASKLSQLRVVLPPLLEQQQIVIFLDAELMKIDTLIAKAQQAIALMREHRTSLIAAAVTGKIDVRGVVADAGAEVGDARQVGVAG